MLEASSIGDPSAALSLPAGEGERVLVNMADLDAVLDAVRRRLDAERGFTLATLNLDHLVKLRRSRTFRRSYMTTNFVTADGNPIVWLSRLAGRPRALTPGSELVEPLCDIAAERGVPIALVGSTEEVLAAARSRLEVKRPALAVVESISPSRSFDPEGEEAEIVARRVAASGARLCFLALGAPKQEIFAAHAAAIAPHCGFISIGAGLDFIAGAEVRAPLWARRLAIEWLWRLVLNPGRLAGRYARCAMLLPVLVLDVRREHRRRISEAVS